MGYWSNRAKDGDTPMDYMNEFRDRGGSANAFLKRIVKYAPKFSDAYYGLLGCATLMLEDGLKLDAALVKTIYDKAVTTEDENEDEVCQEDVKFFEAYFKDGTILVKKKFKVFIEVDVEAFEEKSARVEAKKKVERVWDADGLKMKVTNA